VLKGNERIDGANCLVLEAGWKVSDKEKDIEVEEVDSSGWTWITGWRSAGAT